MRFQQVLFVLCLGIGASSAIVYNQTLQAYMTQQEAKIRKQKLKEDIAIADI